MMNIRNGIALILLLLVCPALARAEELCYVPSLAVREEYNSNILMDTAAYNVRKDYATVVSPGLQITDKSERLDSQLSLRLDRHQFFHEKDLDATDQSAHGSVQYTETEALKFSAAAGYDKYHYPNLDVTTAAISAPGTVVTVGPPPTTPAPPPPNTTSIDLVAVRLERITSSIAADYQWTELTSLRGAYQYELDSYDRPVYRSTSHDVRAGLVTDLSEYLPRLNGRLNAGYSQYILPESKTVNIPVTVGFSFGFNERWSIQVDGGIRRTVTETFTSEVPITLTSAMLVSDDRKSYGWGRVGDVALNYRLTSGSAELMYTQDLTLPTGIQAASKHDAVTFSAWFRFTSELSASLTTDYSMYRSDDTFSSFVIKQNTASVSPLVRYEFTKDLALEASYQFVKVDFKSSESKADQQVYFVRLIAGFPFCSSSQYK
jgi:hypothetical protein